MNSIPFTPDWALPTPDKNSNSPAPSPAEPQRSEFAESLPVIVAEDDPISREVLIAALDGLGYRVIATRDGREAMEALRAQTTPALAVIDWMMPGMDGIEICRRVREANSVVYIILLTARGGTDRIVEGLQAGADDYLTKPFAKEELRARLQVGARIINLHTALAARVEELEEASAEIGRLRLSIPL
jgi:DNA-binding response OmpR family regulator